MPRRFLLSSVVLTVALGAALACSRPMGASMETPTSPERIEAQTKFDLTMQYLRSTALALESYSIDQGAYPPSSADPAVNMFGQHVGEVAALAGQPTFRRDYGSLTTPIAYIYIWRYFEDPYMPNEAITFSYYKTDAPRRSGRPDGSWILWSAGPDEDFDLTAANVGRLFDPEAIQLTAGLAALSYDPTNGALSSGDIIRIRDPQLMAVPSP